MHGTGSQDVLKLLARRLIWVVPILLVVSFLVFCLVDLAPGDPAVTLAGNSPDPAVIAEIRHTLHLDDPLPVRYATWLGNAATGDLGTSFLTREQVWDMLTSRLPITMSVALVAMIMSTALGVAFGILGALWPRSVVDRAVTVVGSLLIAVPPFWLALVLILQMAVFRQWLPAIGYTAFTESPWEWFRHLIMPGVALSAFAAAETALQLKGSLIDTLGRDYILTTRAKGLTGKTILFKHALRNAALPVVTVLGLRMTYLIGGAIIIEQVFTINGLGSLAITAAQSSDVNVLLGIVMVGTVVAILMNALVDVTYGYLNPKLRT